ncbi:alpha/beta hydrolase fold protein [Trametes elegans]|nr:alpha/beta hydrolase fold protein [Trametes elegans]
MAAPTQVKAITVDNGVDVFYRESYPKSTKNSAALPVYRDLIPRLAEKYRVIAPDLPGFGFTVVPDERKYNYTFASIATTTLAFLDALDIAKFAVYVFDYGAPTAFRIALQRPEAITALITQNGNAYEEGLGQDFWPTVQRAWADPSPENIKTLYGFLTLEATKGQYITGAPNPEAIPPETYHLDYYLTTRPGNAAIQVGLFVDYKNNVALYPDFHKYFREHKPPTLVIWGKNDPIFIPPGAEAFKRDNPNAVVKFVDAGHFALESSLEKISTEIVAFLAHIGL